MAVPEFRKRGDCEGWPMAGEKIYFGQYRGTKLIEVVQRDRLYAEWLVSSGAAKGKTRDAIQMLFDAGVGIKDGAKTGYRKFAKNKQCRYGATWT